MSNSKMSFSGNCCGNFLILSYLSIKIMYVINAVGQLFLLNFFLGTDYHLFGIQVKWFYTGDWLEDGAYVN